MKSAVPKGLESIFKDFRFFAIWDENRAPHRIHTSPWSYVPSFHAKIATENVSIMASHYTGSGKIFSQFSNTHKIWTGWNIEIPFATETAFWAPLGPFWGSRTPRHPPNVHKILIRRDIEILVWNGLEFRFEISVHRASRQYKVPAANKISISHSVQILWGFENRADILPNPSNRFRSHSTCPSWAHVTVFTIRYILFFIEWETTLGAVLHSHRVFSNYQSSYRGEKPRFPVVQF